MNAPPLETSSLNELAHEDFQLSTRFSHRTLSQLSKECVQQRMKHHYLYGKTVGIQGDVEHMIRCMFFLDGFVKTLVLIPLESCSRLICRIKEDVNLDAVVVDENVGESTWPKGLAYSMPVLLPLNVSTPIQRGISTEWLIPTSGTTGIAKTVKHSLDTLRRTVTLKKTRASHAWGLLYDPARFAGIQVILQAMIGGALLVLPDKKDSLLERINLFLQHSVTAISGTPTMWRRILMLEQAARLKLLQITLGGEISDRQIINSLIDTFPKSNITHIYASTEAGVGFAVHDKKEGFPLLWVTESIAGVRLKISDRGTLMVKTVDSIQSYVNRSERIFDSTGWHDTGDLIEVVDDRIIFRGRINGSINIGGNKVMPEEVERRIEELDFVLKTLVRARRSSIVGNLLEASVILETDVKDNKEAIKAIRAHCVEHLTPYKVPVFLKVVDELPMTASGKLARGDKIDR